MKLIILNGPPGVGKSTIASMLLSDLPQARLIDIDAMRRTRPNYSERREESLKEAYDLAEKEIAIALEDSHDVIVDKAISSSAILDRFISVGISRNADIREILLFADKRIVEQRALERGFKPGGFLTIERVRDLWEMSDALRRERNAIVIDTGSRTPVEVYQIVKDTLVS